jgi:hypothetical protein
MFPARFRIGGKARKRSYARSRRAGPDASRRRHRLTVAAEALEDRQLLATLFTPHGGSVLADVKVYTVYWDWNDPKFGDPMMAGTLANKLVTLEGQVNDFFGDITGSGYMADLNQYEAGKGTFGGQDVVTPVPGTPTALPPRGPITTINIQNMVNSEMGAGKPLPAFTGNQLYFVFTPPTTVAQVVRPDGTPVATSNNTSAQGFFGFHAWDPVNSFPYAVIPFPDVATDVSGLIKAVGLKPISVGAVNSTLAQTALDAITGASSHELIEGITDPVAFYTNTGNVATGWWFGSPGFEISDVPGINGNFFTYPKEAGFMGGPYIVQGYWSNFLQISNQPHEWPIVVGIPALPGSVNSPAAIGVRRATNFKPSPPGTTPPPRPTQPGPPNFPTPTPPIPPIHTGPAIPGGASLVQPAIASSQFNPNDLALASQNGLAISTNAGVSWSSTIAFPTMSSGNSSVVYDKKGNLYWSYLNPTTGGITIVTLNPSTGAIVAGPFSVDAPASGFTDVQQVLAADFSTGNPTSNNLAIVWSRLGPVGSSAILLSLSTNQGQTWLAPVTVAASSGTPPTYEYGASVTFGPDGSIDVAYHAQPGYTVASDGGIVPDGKSGQTLVAIYTFNGTTLTQQGSTITAFAAGKADITFNDQAGSRKIAGTKFLTQGSVIPQILANPLQPGTLYVVTVQDPDAGTANPPTSEVVIATLTRNANGSFSTTTATIAPPSSSTFQLFPTATIDPLGDIVVSWYTNASGQTNASGDFLLDADATFSVDGGQTWATPFALDAKAFDPDAGAADVLPGPPPTKGIGNSFGVTIDGSTVFVANDVNTFTGTTPTGQQVAVESFIMPGTLFIPTNLGNNVITISRQSSTSHVDVVQLNGVTVFVGPLASLTGGIQIGNQGALDETTGVAPDVENDTLILNYTNGDPVPAGGISFDAAKGGTNTIEVNADANYRLSDSRLTVSGNSVPGTDTLALENVNVAQLTGGPSNDTFTLDDWSGSTTVTGGTGTNALVVARGTVNTSTLTVSHVQSLSVTGGSLNVNDNFSAIPTVQIQSAGAAELQNGVTLTANVTNSGTLSLGSTTTTAIATIAGNYTQTTTGVLDIKLGGTAAGAYDQLKVTGNVSLAGMLNVSLVHGFVPAVGNSFQIITFMGVLTGDFTTKNFPNLGSPKMFATSSSSGSYTLTVVTT